MEDSEARFGSEPVSQPLDQPLVKLDRNHPVSPPQKAFGQRALSGSNFYYQGFTGGASGLGDPLEHRAAYQKVLTEPASQKAYR
jgi:hypothetical protein